MPQDLDTFIAECRERYPDLIIEEGDLIGYTAIHGDRAVGICLDGFGMITCSVVDVDRDFCDADPHRALTTAFKATFIERGYTEANMVPGSFGARILIDLWRADIARAQATVNDRIARIAAILAP